MAEIPLPVARKSSSTLRWWVFGAAAAITFLLYVPTLWYGFVWDDGHLIVNNAFVARSSPVEIFARGFWFNPGKAEDEGDMSYYRPLPVLTFYFERQQFELSPTGYHLTNVILHTGIVLLLCFVFYELLGSVWLAGLGGLIFGIHPAPNCIVAFVSGRPYLLALLMMLLSFYALLRGRRSREGANPKTQNQVAVIWPLLCGLGFLLAMTALEAAVFFGLAAGLWLILNRRQYPRTLLWFGAGLTAVAVYLVLRLGIAHISMMPESVGSRLVSQPIRVINTFGHQLALYFFPFNQKVIYTVGPDFTDFSIYTVLGLLFLLLPPVLILGTWRRARAGWPVRETLGYTWMVLFLLPFSNLLFLGPSGRMLYLSGIGVLIMILTGVRRLKRPAPALRIAAWVVTGLYLALLAGQLLRRNPVWKNELALSRNMTIDAPDSPGGHLNYGAALAEAGRMDEAIEQYRLAVEADSDYVPPHNRLAFALMERGDLAEAVTHFRAVVRLDPGSADARNNLALTLKRSGELDSAIAEYQAALQLAGNPDTTLNNLGRAYLARGDLRAAIEAFKVVLSREPYFQAARENLIQCYITAGFPDSAALLRQ
jgi:protein O-mannosyl-transferase